MRLYILKLTLLICPILVVSCDNDSLSKKERVQIQQMIDIHNISTNAAFIGDSMDDQRARLIRYSALPATERNHKLEIDGKAFKALWNKDYNISRDYNLTLETYLDYCKKNNKDPKTFYQFMN